MSDSARDLAASIISGGKLKALEASGLVVVRANELANLRTALGELAYDAEYAAALAKPCYALRASLTFAWHVLGDAEARAARQRAGCVQCGGRIASAADDLCAACADTLPSIEVAAEYEHRPTNKKDCRP